MQNMESINEIYIVAYTIARIKVSEFIRKAEKYILDAKKFMFREIRAVLNAGRCSFRTFLSLSDVFSALTTRLLDDQASREPEGNTNRARSAAEDRFVEGALL